MEISNIGGSGVVSESTSSVQKSSQELERDVGRTHVIQKSSSIEAEESSRCVSKSVSSVKSVSVSSSVVKQSSVSQSFSSTSSSTSSNLSIE